MSQGASNGPSQGAGNNQFVKFSRGAAQRIAKVVRIVEAGDRNQSELQFDHPVPSRAIRVCTFTGQWATAATAVVTFYNVTTTPNTVAATNLYFPLDVQTGQTAECVIARGGAAWYLASANLTKLKSYAADKIQLLGHNDSGYSEWFSITTCSTAAT